MHFLALVVGLEGEKNPKAVYNLIIKNIPKASENLVQEAVAKWNTQKPESTL